MSKIAGAAALTMAKAARARARDSLSVAEFHQEDDLLSSSPFGTALVGDPGARDSAQVRQALNWWLEQLPVAGVDLSWELRAPGDALFEAFRRGRLAVYSKGFRLQEEGEEVRNYTIVLLGRCRLRCRAPAPKTAPVAGDAEEDEGIDPDGFASYDTIGKGEALGLAPSESRSPCEVQCAERTTLLLLSPDDYAATLRPYHRECQAQAVEFIQRHGVCPAGTTVQLQRLACGFRQRRVLRGSMVLRAGEPQRHVWILKSGSCSVMGDPQEDLAPLEEEEESASGSESEDEVSRFERLRAQPTDAGEAQAAAAAQGRCSSVAKYAKTFMKKNLETRSQRNITTLPSKSGNLVRSAVLSTPGLMLGEEILLYEGRKQLTARCCSTVRTDEECQFYVIDVTAFRQLVMYVGVDAIADRVKEKFDRRSSQFGRNGKVAQRLVKQAKQLKRMEMRREEHQRIRLPPSVGYKGVEVLEDVDQYLRVVFDHRKAPRNDKNPATLSVLEGLGLTPMNINSTSSHGVGAMLRLYSDPAALKRHRAELRWGSGMAGRRNSSGSQNPIGEFLPAGTNYLDAPPPSRFAPEQPPPPLASSVRPPSGGGIFFQTEPELEEPETRLERSSSVPVLPRLGESGVQEQTLLDARRSMAHSSSWRGGSSSSSAEVKEMTEKPRVEKAEKKASRLAAQIMKAFQRVVPGKSILILTDRPDVRKSIMKSLVVVAKETDLVFVRTTSELWHRLRDPKERHHAVILDLSKSELQVDGFLKCCREHQRYGSIPIVVLSSERDLSESVRSNCSFVVFHPVAPTMLREALVWCFDRKTLLGNARYDTPELGSSTEATARAFEFTVTAMPAAAAIPVS